MAAYEVLKEAIITGNETEVESQVNRALSEGADAPDIMNNGLIAGMETVGQKSLRKLQ